MVILWLLCFLFVHRPGPPYISIRFLVSYQRPGPIFRKKTTCNGFGLRVPFTSLRFNGFTNLVETAVSSRTCKAVDPEARKPKPQIQLHKSKIWRYLRKYGKAKTNSALGSASPSFTDSSTNGTGQKLRRKIRIPAG